MTRTPTDGQPYYCALCGLGYNEFMACEMPDCKLESHESAASRRIAQRAKAPTNRKKASTLVHGDRIKMEDNTVRTVNAIEHGFLTLMSGQERVKNVAILWVEGGMSMVERDFGCEIADN